MMQFIRRFLYKLKKTKFIKLTNIECIHNDFKFNEGLNIDTIPITKKECDPGGIYFTTLENIYKWLRYNGKQMYYAWDIEIPEDAIVYHYSDKSKADKIILSNCRPIYELDM